jgi:hypothetical protein
MTPAQQAQLAKLKGMGQKAIQSNPKLAHIYNFFNDKAYRNKFIQDRRAGQGAGGFTPGVAPQVARPPVAPMMDDPNRTTYKRGGKVAKKPGVSDKLVRRAASRTPGARPAVPAAPPKKGGRPNPFAKTGKGGKPPVKGKANPFAKGNPFASKGKGKSKPKPFKKFS